MKRLLLIILITGSSVIYGQNVVDNASRSAKIATVISKDSIGKYDKVFTVVEIPASFPGGPTAWRKYLQQNLNANIPVKKHASKGLYKVIVTFNVDKEGNVSNVQAENDPGYGTKEEAIRVISEGPKWMPAVLNGRNVICRHRQSITFQVQ